MVTRDRCHGYALSEQTVPSLEIEAFGRMTLAGVTVADSAVEELAWIVREAGAVELADRLERAATDG